MSFGVAEDREGNAINPKDAEPDQAECGQAFSPPRHYAPLPQEDGPTGPPRGKIETSIQVKIQNRIRGSDNDFPTQ